MKFACLTMLVMASVALHATDSKLVAQRLKEGRALAYDRHYDQALQKYEEVLKKDSANLEALIAKMDALAGLRKTDQAQAIAKQSAEKPSAKTVTLEANAKFLKRDFKGAEADLKRAIQMDAKAYMSQYLLGYLYFRTEKTDEAIQHLKAAIKANPDFPEPYYVLGDIYFSKGNSKQVLENWGAYLKKAPKTGKRYAYVNKALQKMGGH